MCPLAMKNYLRKIINQTSPTAFQFPYTVLAIDITDGHGISNEVHCELLF